MGLELRSIGGRKSVGDGKREGWKWDSQWWKPGEKKKRLHKDVEAAKEGRELGVKCTGKGKFRTPCPPSLPNLVAQG